MAKQVKFNSNSLLDLKFGSNVKGYDALEVDKTLDSIIEDYKIFESELSNSNEMLAKLTREIDELKAKIRNYEVELAKKESAMKSLPKNVSSDNVTLLKRIGALERALYAKGVNPDKI